MIDFKPVTLADKLLIESFTMRYAPRGCNYAFANLCAWQFTDDSRFAVVNDYLVIRFNIPNEGLVYLMPIGHGNLNSVISMLDEDASANGQPLCLQGPYPELKEKLDSQFPTLFDYSVQRDLADYVYLRQSLAELKGKNYQAKRNHVNHFAREYAYRYAPLTPDMLPLCLELEAKWYARHESNDEEGPETERRALDFHIRNYEALGLTGGALWVKDEIVAFTFGSPINSDTFCTHIEKATMEADGAYSVINREFALHLPEQFVYINREEDLGLPGLRKSKLSYHPDILFEKCFATKK